MGEALGAIVELGADVFGFGGGEALGLGAAGAAEGLGAGLGAAEGAGAAGLETGFGTIGAGVGGAATGGGIADIVGTGAGLAGGATGLEGTAIAGGTDIASILGGGAGASALGTAADFVANPGASGFNASAVTPSASAFNPATASPTTLGGTQAVGSGALPSNVANANAAIPGGNSVFESGAASVPGVSSTGAPSAVPAGASASSLAAPTGVNAPVDATASLATSTTAPGAAAAQPSSSIESLLGKAGTQLSNNPLQAAGIALGAGGLGFNILNGQKQTANQAALSGAAQTAANTGQTALNAGLPIAQANNTTGQGLIQSGEAMQTYLSTGQLPPQYSQQIDQAINDAKTRAISNAAQQGQPTDPTKNTSLATTLAGIDNQRAQMTTQVANTLFSAGGSNISAGAGLTGNSASSLLGAGQNASGLSANLYSTLVQNDTTQAANTGKAIATLAAALNGKSNTGTTTAPTG